jgi:arylsulfatase A-like enzyme
LGVWIGAASVAGASVPTPQPFDAIAQIRNGVATLARPVELGIAPAFGSDRFVIRSERPNRIDFPVTIPARGVLRTGFVVLPPPLKTAVRLRDAATAAGRLPSEDDLLARMPPVRFLVQLDPSEGEPLTLVDRVVDTGRPADRRWHDLRIDLSAYAGRRGILRLAHTIVDHSGRSGEVEVGWTRPVLFDPRAEAARPNLLLVTIDALRADHLSSYGYARATTPNLDRLAGEGLRFAHAFTNAPMTVPSLPQMLASRYYPDRTDPTLATQLFADGVPATKAIVNNVYLGLWLTFRSRETFDSVTAAPLRAERITRAALRWLDTLEGERFALYLHYLDTHTPYEVPAPWAAHFADPGYHGALGLEFRDPDGARAGRYTGADRRHIVDLYDGAIRYVDAAIGTLLEGLRERGLLDRTLVVVTADHGEELWDHGGFFHGQSLYHEQLSVPLIMRLPGAVAAGTVVRDIARTVDLLPTMTTVLGLPGLPAAAGATLVTGEGAVVVGADREVFARAANPLFPHRFALQRRDHKYIVTVETGVEELYDRGDDPGERQNLADEPAQARLLGELRERLDVYRSPMRLTGFQVRAVATDALPHQIELTVETGGGIPLTDIDRIGLDAASQLAYENGGRRLRWTGVVSQARAGFRFAHDLLRVGGAEDRLRFEVRVDGRPLPADAIRIAAGVPAPSSPFQYMRGVPALDAAAAPPLEIADGHPVMVGIWRAPTAEPGLLPPEGVLTPAHRERLRALGYAE